MITTGAALAAAIIVLAIVLRVLSANPSNSLVSAIHDAGNWLSSPFHGLFSPHNGDVRGGTPTRALPMSAPCKSIPI